MAHQSSGVNETARALTVPASAPFNPTQAARTAAGATSSTFVYTSVGKKSV